MSHSLSYMPHLDALRAFAVVAVMYSHWTPKTYHFNVPWGTMGVQLFFVLSGYLITRILLNALHGTPVRTDAFYTIRNFIVRRALRIFPAYYALLLFSYFRGYWPFVESIHWHVFYLSNFYFFSRQDFAGPASHLWSLSVEEQYYLVWPWVTLLPVTLMLRVAGCVVAVSFATYVGVCFLAPSLNLIGLLPIPAFMGISAGSVLAILKFEQSKHLPIVLQASFGCGLAFVLLIAIDSAELWKHPLMFVLIRTSMILSFVWLVDRGTGEFSGVFGRICSNRGLQRCGELSYGLYLYHLLAPQLVRTVFRSLSISLELHSGIVGFACNTVCTFVIAWLSWHLIEAPMNRLKVYFPYQKESSVVKSRG